MALMKENNFVDPVSMVIIVIFFYLLCFDVSVFGGYKKFTCNACSLFKVCIFPLLVFLTFLFCDCLFNILHIRGVVYDLFIHYNSLDLLGTSFLARKCTISVSNGNCVGIGVASKKHAK